MVYVKYFVPEDGDESAHPNVFKVQGCAGVAALTLGLLKKSFPVEGAYHFRFLTVVPGLNDKVWMDLLEDGEVVPHSETGEVFAKVSRIGVQHYNITHQAPSSSSASSSSSYWAASSSSSSVDNRQRSAAVAASQQRSPSSQTETRRDSFGQPGSGNSNNSERNTLLDSGNGSSGSGSGKQERRNSERLISFTDDNTPTLSKSPIHSPNLNSGDGNSTCNGEEGLLDFDGDFGDDTSNMNTNNSLGGSHSDLFSLDSTSITSNSTSLPLSPAPIGSLGGSTMHNPLGSMQFGAQNPMGASQQSRGGMNGNGNGNGNGQGGFGMGVGPIGMNAIPSLNQMQQSQRQQNKNAFTGLDNFGR